MSTTSPTRPARNDSPEKARRDADEAATSARAKSSTVVESAAAEAPAPADTTPAAVAATDEHLPAASALADDLVREIYLTRLDHLPCFYDGKNPKQDAKARGAAIRAAVLDLKTAEQPHADSPQAKPGQTEPPLDAKTMHKLMKRALRRNGKPTTEKHGVPKPAAAYHSESEQLSILRNDWTDHGVQLAVDWSTAAMRLELQIGNETILDGRMAPRVGIGGSPCEAVGPWEEVCWESNVDVDYLELEIALAGGIRLQRQIILTRRDGLLFLADAVVATNAAKLACELAIPFAPAGDFTPAADTREASVRIGRQRLLLLPIGLGEWRSESCHGDLTFEAGNVALRQQAASADALYVPLCIVFDRKRAKRECTWRRLTVGENLRLVAANEAVGYRWQLGKEHWIAYRSLTEERANRTVLGVNLQTNFLLSRFTTEGNSEPLIEIDD